MNLALKRSEKGKRKNAPVSEIFQRLKSSHISEQNAQTTEVLTDTILSKLEHCASSRSRLTEVQSQTAVRLWRPVGNVSLTGHFFPDPHKIRDVATSHDLPLSHQ